MAESASISDESQQEIIEYLSLQNHSNKEQIICDLLTQGRRSFCFKYVNHLPANILSKVNTGKVLELMKQDIRRIWEIRLIAVQEPEIQRFYDEIQANTNQFDDVLSRFAENGCTHTKLSSQILFLVLELTFSLIVSDKNAAVNLWISLTTDGLKSLNDFSDDISPEQLMEELAPDSQSPLYLALRNYYKNELDELFEKYLQNIDTRNYYESIVYSLTRDGWLKSMKILSMKIPPRCFEPFHKVVLNMVQEQKSNITKSFQVQVQASSDSDDRLERTRNKFGRHARLGISGKFYCGGKLDAPECSCCNGKCGRLNGCNCSACMLLDVQKRQLPQGWLVNREGASARCSREEPTKFYCGRMVLSHNPRTDGYCGPTNGDQCDSCSRLTQQQHRRYGQVWGN